MAEYAAGLFNMTKHHIYNPFPTVITQRPYCKIFETWELIIAFYEVKCMHLNPLRLIWSEVTWLCKNFIIFYSYIVHYWMAWAQIGIECIY